MKKIFIIILSLFLSSTLMAAGSDSSSGSSSSMGDNLYEDAVKLVKRAGKLEKKDKTDKAKKLYAQAFNKLEKAYKSDKKNPDILNYMGFTTRKTGNFEKAEKFYLEGLSLKPNHNGINEYLGELYVQTNRIDKANERLEVLKSCNCKEYGELELIIKNNLIVNHITKYWSAMFMFMSGIFWKIEFEEKLDYNKRYIFCPNHVSTLDIPLVTAAIPLPLLFMGSLLTESFFGIPGLGSYTIDAIRQQDFAIVRAMVFLGSVLYILGLLLTDLSYGLVDPRVKVAN